MQLTPEQQDIIHSTGNIRINAIAGSGKATTVIEYARAQPGSARILYLAFNKSVKLEATKKFAEKRLRNVKVETAHSFTFKRIIFKHNYEVKLQGYKTNEIAEVLKPAGYRRKTCAVHCCQSNQQNHQLFLSTLPRILFEKFLLHSIKSKL